MFLELCYFLGITCLILWVVSLVLKKRMVPKLEQIHAKGRFLGYGEKFVTEVRKLSKGSTTIVRNRNWQPDKPLLLFLHGFPDDIHSFDHQMNFFNVKMNVLAITLPGYERRSKRSHYPIPDVAKEIEFLMTSLKKSLGYSVAVVVGHDWGSTVAGMVDPNLCEAKVLLSVPTLQRFKRGLNRMPWQFYFSSYMFRFAIPLYGPWWFKNGGFEILYRTWDLDILKDDPRRKQTLDKFWKLQGRAEHAIMYYKSQFRVLGKEETFDQPTLFLYGERDGCVHHEFNDAVMSGDGTDKLQKKMVQEAGHFLHQTHPSEINQLMDEFLSKVLT